MTLKLATFWTYAGATVTSALAVVSYLQTQSLPAPWPADLGNIGIGLCAMGLFFKTLDASAPKTAPQNSKKGGQL